MAAMRGVSFAGLLSGVIHTVMIGSIAGSHSIDAPNISKHSSDSPAVNAILLNGKIEIGDTYRLTKYISSLPRKPKLIVYLNSPGGNLVEGIELGKYFYRAGIETVLDAKARCESACALAFLGGSASGGKAKRIKYSSASLGFRSLTRDLDKESYTGGDMKQIVRETQVVVLNIIEYLRVIGADHNLLRLMLSAQPTNMHYLSNDDAIAFGVLVWDEDKGRLIEPQTIVNRLDHSRS